MRSYLVAMYKKDGSTPIGQVREHIIEVEGHQRGEVAAQKALETYPDCSVLYWGLWHHSLTDPAGITSENKRCEHTESPSSELEKSQTASPFTTWAK